MLRFIFSMLFYGAFLAILLIVCMWFFFDMTIQQSISWLYNEIDKTSTAIVQQAGDIGKTIAHVGDAAEKQLERVNKAL